MVSGALTFLARNTSKTIASSAGAKDAIGALKFLAKGTLIFLFVLLVQYFAKKTRKVRLFKKLDKLESEKNAVWSECARVENELRIAKARQANLRHETDARIKDTEDCKLELVEVSAVFNDLTGQLTTERERLQSLCVERERARLDLENTWVETNQLKRKVNDLSTEYKQTAEKASSLNAKRMAAEEETSQATVALKELLASLGKLSSPSPPQPQPQQSSELSSASQPCQEARPQQCQEKVAATLPVAKLLGTTPPSTKLVTIPRGKARSRSRLRKDFGDKPEAPQSVPTLAQSQEYSLCSTGPKSK